LITTVSEGFAQEVGEIVFKLKVRLGARGMALKKGFKALLAEADAIATVLTVEEVNFTSYIVLSDISQYSLNRCSHPISLIYYMA
jgi:hypothetical protein